MSDFVSMRHVRTGHLTSPAMRDCQRPCASSFKLHHLLFDIRKFPIVCLFTIQISNFKAYQHTYGRIMEIFRNNTTVCGGVKRTALEILTTINGVSLTNRIVAQTKYS